MTRQDGGTDGYWPPGKRPHMGWPITAVAPFLALVGALFFLGACSGSTVIGKVASVVAKPVLGLAVKDAQTTLAWVEREVEAGRMPPEIAGLAKRCPESVIAIDDLRKRLAEGTEKVDGFRGLIYYGTLNRYSRDGVQGEASANFKQFADACMPLIPAEKLIKVF